jgi:hypothetical protein
MKPIGRRSEKTLDKNNPHPSRINRKPAYIGLRVCLYIPKVTREEDVPGIVGLIVVLACLKDDTPEIQKTAPIPVSVPRIISLYSTAISVAEDGREASHIKVAKMTTSRIGGIFSFKPDFRPP